MSLQMDTTIICFSKRQRKRLTPEKSPKIQIGWTMTDPLRMDNQDAVQMIPFSFASLMVLMIS